MAPHLHHLLRALAAGTALLAAATALAAPAADCLPDVRALLKRLHLTPIDSRLDIPKEILATIPFDDVSIRTLSWSEKNRIAAVTRRYLKDNFGLDSEVIASSDQEDGDLFIAVTPPSGTSLAGKNWLAKLAAKAGEGPFPHKVGFSLRDLFRDGALGHYQVDVQHVNLSWKSLAEKMRMPDVNVHEWKHYLRAMDRYFDLAEAAKPLEDVSLPVGKTFELSGEIAGITSAGKTARFALAKSTAPDLIAFVDQDAQAVHTMSRSDFLALFADGRASWARPPQFEFVRTDYGGPLAQTSYKSWHVIEESANYLTESQLALRNADKLAAHLKLTAESGTDFHELVLAFNESKTQLAEAEARAMQGAKFYEADLPILDEALKAAEDGTLKIEKIAAQNANLADRELVLPSGRKLRYTSGQINWYRPRGVDWSIDPSVAKLWLGQEKTRLLAEKASNELVVSTAKSLRDEMAALKALIEAKAPGKLAAATAELPLSSQFSPAELSQIEINAPSNSIETIFDATAVETAIKDKISLALRVEYSDGPMTYYGSVIESVSMDKGYPVAHIKAGSLAFETPLKFVRVEGFDAPTYDLRHAMRDKIVAAQSAMAKSKVALPSSSGVITADELEKLAAEHSEVMVTYRWGQETHTVTGPIGNFGYLPLEDHLFINVKPKYASFGEMINLKEIVGLEVVPAH